jgi:hypothetical protein
MVPEDRHVGYFLDDDATRHSQSELHKVRLHYIHGLTLTPQLCRTAILWYIVLQDTVQYHGLAIDEVNDPNHLRSRL